MKKILYVLHSGVTGGTFLTNKDLMRNIEGKYEIYLLGAENNGFKLYSYSNDELILIKEYPRHLNINVPVNNSKIEYHNWSAKEFNNSWLSFIYFDILTEFGIDLVHIRHLINHSFDLPFIAKKLNIPIVLSIHDFYFICPFYVLLDENNQYCGGKCSDVKKNCYCPMNSLNDIINSKEFVTEWRKNVLKMFLQIDYFVTTSNIVKNLFLDIYNNRSIINEDNFIVIEHGRDFPKLTKEYYEAPSFDNPIKILCPANHLNIMKGSDLIRKIKDEDKNNLIEFHFLGNCHDGIENYGVAHGTFERDEFYKHVKEIKPSFVGIFSIWPETFCHTLTEAWSCGIPVIGTNIGVIEDRILKNNGGWIIDRNNYKMAYDSILKIVGKNIDEPDSYFNIQSKVQQLTFKSTKEMSMEYILIYNELLEKYSLVND